MASIVPLQVQCEANLQKYLFPVLFDGYKLDLCISSQLDFWIFGFLDFWIFGFFDKYITYLDDRAERKSRRIG